MRERDERFGQHRHVSSDCCGIGRVGERPDLGGDGIDTASTDAVLSDNRANGNGAYGIEAKTPSSDGGGNRAHGNVTAAQCLNVACT